MQVQYIKEYSNCLDREMEYKIYGQGGGEKSRGKG